MKISLDIQDQPQNQLNNIPKLTLGGVLHSQKQKKTVKLVPPIRTAQKFLSNHYGNDLQSPTNSPTKSPMSRTPLNRSNDSSGTLLISPQKSQTKDFYLPYIRQKNGSSVNTPKARDKAQTMMQPSAFDFSPHSLIHSKNKGIINDEKIQANSPNLQKLTSQVFRGQNSSQQQTQSPYIRKKNLTQFTGGKTIINLEQIALFNREVEFQKPKFQLQEEEMERKRLLYKQALPFIKIIEQEFQKLFLNDHELASNAKSYGVDKDYLVFYFLRYLELSAGNTDINSKNLEFFRISSVMFQQLFKKVEKILERENCPILKDILLRVLENSHLIQPQTLFECLGSNERIPKLFKTVVFNLNTYQDFYLQDYVQQKYKITDASGLNMIKSVIIKDKDVLLPLIQKLPNKVSFTFPEFYVAKCIIWQTLQDCKYNTHIINDIVEIIETYRFLFWERKRKEIEGFLSIFTVEIIKLIDLSFLAKEDQKIFISNIYINFFINFDLVAACKNFKKYIPDIDLRFLQNTIQKAAKKVWLQYNFDPYLFEDFKIKLRKCTYLLKLQSRPFNTDMQMKMVEEVKNLISKESQQVGGDLLNPRIFDIMTFIMSFLFSSKDCISIYDILGAIEAYHLSKMVGKQIYLIFDMAFKSLDLDPKKAQKCLGILQELNIIIQGEEK